MLGARLLQFLFYITTYNIHIKVNLLDIVIHHSSTFSRIELKLAKQKFV